MGCSFKNKTSSSSRPFGACGPCFAFQASSFSILFCSSCSYSDLTVPAECILLSFSNLISLLVGLFFNYCLLAESIPAVVRRQHSCLYERYFCPCQKLCRHCGCVRYKALFQVCSD